MSSPMGLPDASDSAKLCAGNHAEIIAAPEQDRDSAPITITESRLGARTKVITVWSLIFIVLVVLGIPASRLVRDFYVAKARIGYKSQLTRILVAINQYQADHGCFPPAYTIDSKGRRLQSWRVLILPQLGYLDLYQKINLNEPWDSPYNRQFHAQRPDVYRHTWIKDTLSNEAHVMAVVGRDTAWPEQYSVTIRDLTRGTSNTGLVIEYSNAEISWMEPRDLMRKELRTHVVPFARDPANGFGGVHMAFADGRVRFLPRSIERRVLSGFFARDFKNEPLHGVEWPPAAEAEPGDLPEARPAAAYPASTVTPYLAYPVDGSKNVIYCSTFQIIWDRLRSRGGGMLKFAHNVDFVTKLNAESFPVQDLRPSSYVARDGLGPDIVPQLSKELSQKHGKAGHLAQNHADSALVLYCYLLKQLPFNVDFDRFELPLEFHVGSRNAKVEGFGIDSLQGEGERYEAILKQVQILDHLSDDDFILKLKTRDERDEIFLAKVKPETTLKATFDAVQRRIDRPAKNGFRTTLGGGDKLLIPVLQLTVDRQFNELLGLGGIVEARQTIKFRLDETGSIIESEAMIVGEFDDRERPYDPHRPRQLVFDRPFLLFVRETQAKAPYLVMWIANDELMEASKK